MENDVTSSETYAHRLEQVYEQLETELGQPAVIDRLRNMPGESEWSAMQIMGHMVEMIPYWLHHCQTLIAATTPPQFGRTLDAPERLEGVEQGAAKNPDELMRLLKQEVTTAGATIRAMSPEARDKKGIHIRRGEMSVNDILEVFLVSHAEDHLAQVRKALQE